jgi:HEAT repeat protein
MRKKLCVGVACLVIAIGSGLVWRVDVQPEPSYQGRGLSAWLKDYEELSDEEPRDPDIPVGGRADEALQHIGTNAIPTLLRMLYTREGDWEWRMKRLVEKQQLVKIHVATQWECSHAALYAFAALGSQGKGAVPAIVRGLSSKDEQTRLSSATALEVLHSCPELAVPALARCLTDQSELVQTAAMQALGVYKPAPKWVLPGLIQCLENTNSQNHLTACAVLREYGPAAKPAVPALVHLVKIEYDKYWQSSWGIAEALETVDPEAAAKAGVNFSQ